MLARDKVVRKPVIGFSTWRRTINIPPYGNFTMEVASREYLESAQRQGGIAVMLPHGDLADVAPLLDGVDGLVLIGGDDVDPELYGEANDGLTHDTDRGSDEFQLALISAARERALPTLAVCRGVQLANVAAGGTLHQDISDSELPHQAPDGDGSTLPTADHRVDIIEPGCVLSSLYGGSVEVNSIHHQSIARVGEGLRVVAYAPDGTVEGVESDHSSWPMIGVQWHPEKIANGAPLFRWLVQSAAQHRRKEA